MIGGARREGVGVVKDKGLKLDEMKVSRTLGGAVECRVQGRGKWRGCRCYSARIPQSKWRGCRGYSARIPQSNDTSIEVSF